MVRKSFAVFLVILSLLAFSGCASTPTTSGQTQTQSSPEWLAYNALDTTIKAYDLGMTTLKEMTEAKVITKDQWEKGAALGQKVYDTWRITVLLVKAWATMPSMDPGKSSAYDKVQWSMKTLNQDFTSFQSMVQSFRTRQ